MDASNMDVTIDHIAKDGGKLKAFATVTFDGMFRVHGIFLMFFFSVPAAGESVPGFHL